MSDRLARFAPLITGGLFVVLVLIGIRQEGNPPSTSDSSAAVLAYYQSHYSKMGDAGFSMMLSVVVGLIFYGIVRAYLGRAPRAEWAATIGFGAAVMFGVGSLVNAGVDFTFSDVGTDLNASTAQTLNALQGDLGAFLIAAALSGLMLGFGIAMLRGELLPRWFGWITVAIGVLAAAGPLIGIALPLEAVWVLVLSIMLFQRDAVVSPRTPTTPGATSSADA
jgi:Flp pilus assembly pilin Flp